MTVRRRVELFGDTAVLATVETVGDAHRLATAIVDARWPGIEDVVVGFEAVTIIADPTIVDVSALADEVARLDVAAGLAGNDRGHTSDRGRLVEIPVTFDGADLEYLAHQCTLSSDQVVELLTASDLTVAFLGFAPGFAYLVGLPPPLIDIPRRRTPRPSVPAGAVAVGGGFAGIYPQSSPGGWHLVGSSTATLFDPDTPPYSMLLPGDRVRFVPADHAAVPTVAPARRLLAPSSARAFVVESPGLLTLVEDLGRAGTAGLGVPRSGAADPFLLRSANRLVGNDDAAAALEVTASGPTVRFTADAHIAVVGGADTRIDGVGLPADCVAPVSAGQVLSIGTVRNGVRAYLAVDGGIDTPVVLGSRSSDVLAHLGPGPLVASDVVGLGPPRRPHGRLEGSSKDGHEPHVVRVMAGPDQFGAGAVERLCETQWEVQTDSDRVGVRLRGDALAAVGATTSRGMVTGAIQVPPDGQPIVLLCDHATVGGYPVVATVVSADFGVLGQHRPGDMVRFTPVDQPEALAARARRERTLDRSIVGWFPVRSD